MTTEIGALPEPQRQSRTRMVVVVIIQVLCVAFVAHTLWKSRSDFDAMPKIGVVDVVFLFGLNAVGHLQRTLEFTYMLRRLGVREPFGEGFLLTGAGFLLNHLPFNAGFIMRAVVLRRDHALPYSSYVSLTMVNAVVNIGVGALLGAIGLSLGERSSHVSSLVIGGLVALLAASILSLYLPALPVPGGSNVVARQVRNLARGVTLLRGNGAAVAFMALLAFSKIVFIALRLAICFNLLQRPLSAVGTLLVAVVQNLMAIVNVTPGNLGLREIVVSVMSAEFGTSQSIGLAAASIDRVVSLLYAVTVGLPGIRSVSSRTRRAA